MFACGGRTSPVQGCDVIEIRKTHYNNIMTSNN